MKKSLILLFKQINGKMTFVDYGMNRSVNVYVKRGFFVRVLTGDEVDEYRAKNDFYRMSKELKGTMIEVAKEIYLKEISWTDKVRLLKLEIVRWLERCKRIEVVHRVNKYTIWDYAKAVAQEIKNFFTPMPAWRYQMAYA
jgi:DNA-binding transcriptional regulator PaaX